MASTRILNATDIVTLAGTDVVPVERPANSTPYKATLTEIEAFIHALQFSIPAITGDSKWHFKIAEATFNGHKDQVLMIGYNASGLDDANESIFVLAFETDYWTSATEHVAEWYLEWTEKTGSANTFRPIHVLIDRLTNTDVQIVLNGKVTFSNHDSVAHSETTGAGEWSYAGDGTYAANKGVVLRSPDGTKYRIKVANGGALSTEVVA